VRIVLRDNTREIMLVSGDELSEFHSQPSALSFLRRFLSDPVNRMTLRNALAEEHSHIDLWRWDEQEVLEELAGRLVFGHVVIVAGPNLYGQAVVSAAGSGESTAPEMTPREAELAARETAQAAAAAEPAPEEETTWLEIELVDEEGNPVPGEQYQVELPDGVIRVGRLDAQGRASLKGLDPGTCKVTFPNLDEPKWSFVKKA